MSGKVGKSPAVHSFDRLVGYGTLSLVGALLGLLLVPEQEAYASGNLPILVAGLEVAPESDADAIARKAAKRFLAQRFAIVADGRRVAQTRSALGARVDTERLASLIEQARDPRSPLRRVYQQVRSTGPLRLPLPVKTDARFVRPAVVKLKDAVEHYTRSSDDRPVEKRSRKGLILDLHGTIDAVEAAMAAGGPNARARLIRQPKTDDGID